uniref:Uncharacterized protein n=1 Tax=Hyaloperonospora arabidopsidis (strain Emoy2) TaxID=559515 RepID=M4BR24_HYAAE
MTRVFVTRPAILGNEQNDEHFIYSKTAHFGCNLSRAPKTELLVSTRKVEAKTYFLRICTKFLQISVSIRHV